MVLRPLPQDLQIYAKSELNENPKSIHEDIRIIKEWIVSQPHLNACMEDQWILGYLRGCKFSIQKTKEKIDYYYRIRTLIPELYSNRDPSSPEVKEFLDKKIYLPLETNKNGPQFVLFRFDVENIDHLSLLTLTKASLMLSDIVLIENDYLMRGICIIVDYKGMSLSRIVELSLNQVKIILSLQKAYPVRLNKIFVLNCPVSVAKATEAMKTFLSKKLRDKISICAEGYTMDFLKHVPAEILPKEYGGEASLNKLSDHWKQKIEDYRDWFEKDAAFGFIRETKEIQATINDQNVGLEGSFRKIELD